MFEVIISAVKTGRIKRAYFDSRTEAEQHVAKKVDSLLNRTRNGRPAPVSLGDYRMEILFRDVPPMRQLPRRGKKAQAA